MEGGGGETQAEYSGHWDGSKLPDSMASALYFLKYFFLFFVLYFTFSIFLSLSLSLLYLRNPQVLCCSLLSIVRWERNWRDLLTRVVKTSERVGGEPLRRHISSGTSFVVSLSLSLFLALSFHLLCMRVLFIHQVAIVVCRWVGIPQGRRIYDRCNTCTTLYPALETINALFHLLLLLLLLYLFKLIIIINTL